MIKQSVQRDFKTGVMLVLLTAAAVVHFGQAAHARGVGDGEARPTFESLDANGDGALTAEEFSAPRDHWIANADSDSDGALTMEEVAIALTARAVAGAERMFARQDKDGDGMLSRDELAPDENRWARRFARADRDWDGVITQEEFEQLRGQPRSLRRHFRTQPSVTVD